ncbi:unnamed protein product [Phytophthora fragariaefolia]|uniref:Unnamed protein product n=1 Tax=Phytophthora fragariaefolia TaxID=1490495 RepID=A0A9W6U164_9STRA|nr:unnamed protein product [Phytophthora fragariaefolia]
MWRRLLLLSAAVCCVLTEASQSGCDVCADTGDCSRAYRGEQGQFCGHWLDRANDRRPCCCPTDSVCKVSNYACNCGYASGADPYHGGSDLLWLWWFLGSLALLLCCCGFCYMAFMRPKHRGANTAIPVAAPVSDGQLHGASSTTYASAPPEPGCAAATPAYGRYYGQSRGGGMNAGTGAALGGTAGLVGGLLLGEALADHGGYAGDAGGFGGGDAGGFGGGGGDFGGDF